MTEQEKRALFFDKTGRIATSAQIEYQSFLWGMEGAEESLRQQLDDSQKREVMLRQSLSNLLWAASERDKKNRIRQFDGFMENAREALAATADLKDVILCHVEPRAWNETITRRLATSDDPHRSRFPMCYEPLYRAWEPK